MNLYEIILDDFYKPQLAKVKTLQGKNRLTSSEDVVDFFNKNFKLNRQMQEHVYIIGFNTHQDITGVFLINKGTSDKSIVGKREIFIGLLLTGSSRFIAVHNHPNNDINVSSDDVNITSTLKFIANILEIELIDHIIITKNSFNSMSYQKLI